tara:strand:- start:36 stop:2522 length:2487 start_codon:yes stop_codon:yes gene_type:complete
MDINMPGSFAHNCSGNSCCGVINNLNEGVEETKSSEEDNIGNLNEGVEETKSSEEDKIGNINVNQNSNGRILKINYPSNRRRPENPKWGVKLLFEFKDLHNLELIGDYKDPLGDEYLIVGKCIAQGCNNTFSRRFRSMVTDDNCLCTEHSKIRAAQKRYEKRAKVYTKTSLIKYVQDNNITLVEEYGDHLTRDTHIRGICTHPNCNNIFDRTFRMMIERNLSLCEEHTKSEKKDKIKSTKKENLKLEDSFASCKDLTPNGKLKVECWSSKNVEKPRAVPLKSHKKYWFKCDNCPHEFQSPLCNLARKRNATPTATGWCPYCVPPSHKLCEEEDCGFCFKKSVAGLLENKKTEKGNLKVDLWIENKNSKKPFGVFRGSSTVACWFKCDNCPHEFQRTPHLLSVGLWCPYCSDTCEYMVCENNNCEYCNEKTLNGWNLLTILGNKRRDCFDSEKSGNINPRQIIINSAISPVLWFNCDNCNHSFSKTPGLLKTGTWCPYCCNGAIQKICEDSDCERCFERSLASYIGKTKNGKLKIECFDYENNGSLTPRQLIKGSNTKHQYICDNCPHKFQRSPQQICNNLWCPYCCNQMYTLLCNNINCEMCRKRSFASFQGKTLEGVLKVECWSSKNKLKPHEVHYCSGKKFIFDCSKCKKDFPIALNHIIHGDSWCPRCNESKLETEINNTIEKLGHIPKRQVKYSDCVDERPLPFDNSIFEYGKPDIMIEGDGRQHFENVSIFGGIERYKTRIRHDIIKNRFCCENNIVLLRISYSDIKNIENLIKKAIYNRDNNITGVIYSNPMLYQTAYFPSWKKMIVSRTLLRMFRSYFSQK